MQYVTNYLEATAAKHPDKKAFVDEKREITFSQLQDEAARLGTVLAGLGYFQKPICIFMDKSIDCIGAELGIVYSGNFYTVLDVHMPESRMQKIIEVLEPVAVVTTRENVERIPEIFNTDAVQTVIYEDAVTEEKDMNALEEIRGKLNGESTMFVLFTSGSTGVPKGVIIKDKAFPPYLKWYSDEFHFDENTVFASQVPFYFIMSCPEIYVTIRQACTCYLVPKKAFSFPMVLLNYLKENHINTINWVPSVYCLIANFRALPEVHLDDLKLVMFGGEVMPTKQLNMWRREYPDVTFVNLYGPTETTEMISYFYVDRDIPDTESLPIGIPATYIKTFLLDENGKEVPDGEVGELCATGISIAGGYYRMPEKTAEVFVPNPLYREGDDPEEKIMYRTGDLARVDENGDYVYMGRKDFQIKHMGNRIELGEIETAASSLDGLDRNCCLYDTKRSKIVLFYTGSIDEDQVNEGLTKLLPSYMIPNRYEKIDAMPANVNGKIDRVALKQMI